MNMRYLRHYYLIILFLFIRLNPVLAQLSKDCFPFDYEVVSETEIRLISVKNSTFDRIWITIDYQINKEIEGKETLAFNPNLVCENAIFIRNADKEIVFLWKSGDTAEEWRKLHPELVAQPVSGKKPDVKTAGDDLTITTEDSVSKMDSERNSESESNLEKSSNDDVQSESSEKKEGLLSIFQKQPAKAIITPAYLERTFLKKLEKDPYYSKASIIEYQQSIEEYCSHLNNAADEEEYLIYATANHLQDTLIAHQEELASRASTKREYVRSFMKPYQQKYEIQQEGKCQDRLESILNERLNLRKDAIGKLRAALPEEDSEEERGFFADKEKLLTYGLLLSVLLLLILLVVLMTRRKSSRKTTVVPQTVNPKTVNPKTAPDDDSSIIVRRKTMSILRKQSLEDVIDNNAYMKVDCSDFYADSAVRRLYIKDTCIRDVYHMYAEDLRNPENPKEDGCMVLGRWVEDPETHEYYVSLEQVVLPGEDAIFREYELNFGGKIKLRVADMLRKLRRETDLQYDLTCWIHSHPGLGVFFSNYDNAVHMQLKHPTHPHFLTAIVVDILTPQMDLGIFTFKRNELQVNSRQEMSRMFSLEEWYRWAIENKKSSYKTDDYCSVLSSASIRNASCYDVRLNNSAIIDMCQFLESAQVGMVFHCCGFSLKNDSGTTFLVEKITTAETLKGNVINGCLLAGTHLSIPSITKQIAAQSGELHFVLFYSLMDDSLSCLPIVGGTVVREPEYYSKQQLEDLKIWTRRRR